MKKKKTRYTSNWCNFIFLLKKADLFLPNLILFAFLTDESCEKKKPEKDDVLWKQPDQKQEKIELSKLEKKKKFKGKKKKCLSS